MDVSAVPTTVSIRRRGLLATREGSTVISQGPEHIMEDSNFGSTRSIQSAGVAISDPRPARRRLAATLPVWGRACTREYKSRYHRQQEVQPSKTRQKMRWTERCSPGMADRRPSTLFSPRWWIMASCGRPAPSCLGTVWPIGLCCVGGLARMLRKDRLAAAGEWKRAGLEARE